MPTLREPAAFASWLRRIVWKHCDRITRGKALVTLPLEAGLDVPHFDPEPQRALEEREFKALVWQAVATLSEGKRFVVLLFYVAQHSQSHIAGFLGVPVTTVKKRLQRARQKLKQRMIEMMENEFQEQRPSNEPTFVKHVHSVVASGVHEVYEVKGDEEFYNVVMLKAHDQDRFLPIYIGTTEARNIATRLRGQVSPRPKTYALMAELLSRLGGVVDSVHIGAYRANVYHATLRISAQGQVHDIDCRPSDALALAVQVNAPVFVTPELFYEDATFEATHLQQTVESIRLLALN